ncbi:hypothetical protein LZZ85_28250, partial [Terrimonas sp. NA20]
RYAESAANTKSAMAVFAAAIRGERGEYKVCYGCFRRVRRVPLRHSNTYGYTVARRGDFEGPYAATYLIDCSYQRSVPADHADNNGSA